VRTNRLASDRESEPCAAATGHERLEDPVAERVLDAPLQALVKQQMLGW